MTTERQRRIEALPPHLQEALRRRLAGAAAPEPVAPVRPAVPRNTAVPLSAAQERLWYLHEVDPESVEYNTVRILRLTGDLDVDALRRALQRLVRLHEPLRTVFESCDGGGAQRVRPAGPVPLPVVDLSGLADAERGPALHERLTAELRTPFDLRTGPVFRAMLLRLAPDEHVLVLGMHHIVTDGWSMRVLTEDLLEFYAGRDGPEPDRPQFLDVIAAAGDGGHGEHLRYWAERLAGWEPLDLPLDRPRPRVRSGAGAAYEFDVPAVVTDALRRAGRQAGATLFMTLVAAVQILLSRWTGRTDVAVGTAVSGRGRAELERMVGFFVNMVVLRERIDEDQPFGVLLRRARDTVLDAFTHQDVPFQRVVEAARWERDPSRPPLVDVVVNLQPSASPPHSVAGLEVTEIVPPAVASSVDLAFEFVEHDGRLRGRLTYNSDVLTAGTAERLAGSLTTLLAGLADAGRVADVPLLNEAQRRVLIRDWPDRGPGPQPRTAVELFAAAVAAYPDAPAVISAAGSLSYAELDARVNRLARLLRQHGAGRDTLVAVLLPRGVDYVCAILAVLQTGAAYLPLDPTQPADRLRYMLTDAAPVAVVGAPVPPDLAPGSSVPIDLGAPATRDALAALSAAALDPAERDGPVLVEHPAYVIYTSGSTGRPKGVTVTHRGVHGLVDAQARHFGTGPGARVLQFAATGFDAAFSELGMALFRGGALVTAEADDLLPGRALADTLARFGVTHVTLPPSALSVLTPEQVPPSVTVVVAGEACPPETARVWAAGRRLINAYGPTESTVCASMSDPLTPELPDGIVPIGRPLPGVRCYVLDARMRPLPPGAVGELYLAGPALAQGYRGRPELTAQRFVASPFGPPGERMYRTGDRVRWLADGNLDFLGRTDDQIKLRGFRIEPGEVEAVLLNHPAVGAAAVAVKPDERGTRRLIGYVTPEPDSHPEPAALRAFVRERLPEHMVPATVVLLDRLPLNANGKVDRRALPDPDPIGVPSGGTPPRNQTERILAGIWAEVLGLPEVGVEDNFFDLGGDSILSLQVVARAQQAGLGITAKQTFLRQTVAELAAEATETAVAEPTGLAGAEAGDLPATPIQDWFFATHTASLDQFHQCVLAELAAGTDPAALEAAFAAVVARHDALRLRAREQDGRWRLWTVPAEPGPLVQAVDLSGLSRAEQDAAMAAEIDEAQRRFPVESGPLVRTRLFRLGSGHADRLFVVVHHLAVDAVSWRILLADLDSAYRQAAAGQAVDLGPAPRAFRDWATRLATYARDGGFDAELAHWHATRAALAAVPPLPADGPGGRNLTASAATVVARLSRRKTEALLRAVPRVYRTRMTDALLAGLARVLTGWTGAAAVGISLEGHGRAAPPDGADPSATVGWFTTVYPVALSAPDSGDWGDWLKSVKEQLRAVPAGQGYGALRYTAGHASLAGAEPEVSFNYLGQVDSLAAGDGVVRRLHPVASAPRAHDQERPHLIEINGEVRDGVLEFRWEYCTRRHRSATIQRLADRFVAELGDLVAYCARPGAGGCTPSDFPLAGLDQAGVDRIAGDGRSVEDIYPLTPAQAGMLFHTLSETGRDPYTGHFGVRLTGVTDPEAFAEAWRRVVRATPALRTAVVWQDDRPLQVVHRDVTVPIRHRDLRGLAEDDREREVEQRWAARGGVTLDPSVAPLLRLEIVRLTGDEVHLFWSIHHMVVDGWSFTSLLTEVLRQYTGLAAGNPVEPAPRRPYRDYVDWIRHRDAAAAEKHWRQVLAGHVASTPLPYDRPSVRSHRSRSSRELRLRLPADRSRAVYDAARQARLTVNTVVQGAWAVLLSRHSGERDVCFGATVSGRPADLAGAESMIGLFINTVPVRAEIDPRTPVRPWLSALQDRQLDGRPYEYVSLGEMRRWSGVPGSAPLFDSIVVFENYPVDSTAGAAAGVHIGAYQGDEHTNYALTLTVYAGGELHLALGYDPSLFDESTVKRLGNRLVTLIEGMAAEPEAPIGRLPMLTAPELGTLLGEWNDTTVEFAPDRTVPELFATQVARAPDAPAVRCGADTLTFAGLDDRSGRLADRLIELGAGPGVLVGVCLHRGVDAVVATLAVLKAGAAFVALDPQYPAERLDQMLADADARVVITEEGLADRTAGHRAALVLLDRDAVDLARRPVARPRPVDASELAYVAYTSGTTGRPKGVMVEHRHIVHMSRAWDRRYGLTALAPRVLSVSSMSVDLFLGDFVLGPLFGGEMVVCPESAMGVPTAIAELLLDSAAQLMVTVPTLARAVVDELDRLGRTPDALRVLLVGSEGWQVENALAVRAGLPAQTLVANAYGSTETTVDSTAFPLPGDPVGSAAYVPVGRPLANTRIYVLDAYLRPVPVGAAGECYIGGAGVSRGYLNRPELSAQRFVADPYALEPGARMYRTGDLARWRADGNLECLGRVDDQVKIRGFRVELGEVEAALMALPGVVAAAARTWRDDSGPTRLVGYAVGADGTVLDPVALRTSLASVLPAPAVPATIMVLDVLPVGPSGTVDRRILPTPDLDTLGDGPYVPPATAAERTVAGIFSEVLGVRQVGSTSDFFDLGGDSLLSIQVIARIRSLLGIVVSPRQLFDTPTVAGLAGVLERASHDDEPAVPRLAAGVPVPLSSAQQRMFFLAEVDPGGTEYHVVTALRLTGPLSVPALATALSAVVERHEALRTTVAVTDGIPVQVVHPPAPVELEARELPRTAGTDPEEALRTVLRAAAARPFDLRTGPTWRVDLIRTGPQTHVLLLVIHHIATDGWSMRLIEEQLAAAYAAALHDAPVALPAPAARYAEYAHWQRRLLDAPTMRAHLDYWREQLAGIEPLDLPTDRPRGAVRSGAGAMHLVEVPEKVAAALTAVARRHGATLFMVLVGAVQLLLSRICATSDVVVGTPVSGRGRREWENVVGLFVNTVVLRVRVDERQSFGEFLAQVRDTVLDAFVHEDVPFDRLVEELRPVRDPSRNAVVDVVVGLERDRSAGPSLAGLEVAELTVVPDDVSHDLSFDFVEQPGRLRVAVGYSTALFDRSTVVRLGDALTTLLAGLATDPGRLLDVAVPARPELPGPPAPAADLLTAVFERQAERAGDEPAVTGPEEKLTRVELEASANRLAHHLIAAGAGPGDVVGVVGARRAATVVAILAVLKAGAAYLPVDPDEPPGRIAHLLGDAGVRLVVDPRASGEEPLPGLPGDIPVVRPAEPAEAATIGGRPAHRPDDRDRRTALRPQHPAYVLYTSGSTGRPKGVVVEHRALAMLLAGHGEDLFDPLLRQAGRTRLRTAISGPFTFDGSLIGLALLARGHEVHVVDDLTRRDPEALVGYVRRHRVDHLDLPPSYATQLLAAGLLAPGEHQPAVLTLAGEAIDARLWAALAAAPGTAAVNCYGPTECTVDVLWHRVAGDRPVIGRPVRGTRAYVLDRYLRPVPPGVTGELYLSGAQLARGYLGRPDLTAERFVADPFDPGGRMYRSGDLVRQDADGLVEFVGRTDDQVKIRGFRVEPAEIEAVLGSHPAITAAAVAVRRGAAGRAQLVAYLTGPVGARPGAAELREHAAGSLPAHQVPAIYVWLDELPRGSSGKVDRKRLPEPSDATVPQAPTPPLEPVARQLADIWADVLGVPVVGADDNFFDLGGDSILSLQLVHRIRQAGLAVTVRDLLLTPTVAELATVVTPTAGGPEPDGPVTGSAPLTPVQREFLEAGRLRPGHFNQSVTVAVTAGVNAAALRSALAALLEQHDGLRSRFIRDADGWRQEIGASGAADVLVRHDLSGLAEEPRWAEMRRLAAAADAGLDLATGPLVRALLFDHGPDAPGVLFLTAHHLVVDAVSWRILLTDLETGYAQATAGEPIRLGPRTSSVLDWARRLADHAAGGGFDDRLAYWAAVPEPVPVPVDHDAPATIRALDSVTVTMDSDETAVLLRRAPGVFRSRTHDVLLAALARTLGHWQGSPTVVLDVEGHGREDLFAELDLSRTVGWFTATYPLALRLPDADDWAGLVRSVRRQARTVPDGGVSYGALRHLAPGGASLAARTRAAVSFNYHGADAGSAPAGEGSLYRGAVAPLGREQDPGERPDHLLDVVAVVDGDRLRITWYFCTDVHERSTVGRLAEELAGALREVCRAVAGGGRA